MSKGQGNAQGADIPVCFWLISRQDACAPSLSRLWTLDVGHGTRFPRQQSRQGLDLARMRLLSSIRILRVGLALPVALWMAGAGCMLGCENMVSAAAPSDNHRATKGSELIVSGDACASMHGHDCCAKRSGKSVAQSAKKSAQSHARVENAQAATTSQFETTSTGMFDCPLAMNANAALTKSRPDQSNVATLSPGLTPSVSNTSEQKISFARPLRLPNRGHTYLRCCAFLI